MENDEPFDPLRILAALRAHDVRYVLIGGLAAVAHGSPVEVDGVDISLLVDDVNLKRLGLALEDLEARSREEAGGAGNRASFATVGGRLDCLEMPPEGPGYDDLDDRATEVDFGHGIHARVASVEDLAELRRASGDLVGAAHVASLHGRTGPEAAGPNPLDVSEHDEPTSQRRRDKIWKLLEDVDRFLTNLTEGKPPPGS